MGKASRKEGRREREGRKSVFRQGAALWLSVGAVLVLLTLGDVWFVRHTPPSKSVTPSTSPTQKTPATLNELLALSPSELERCDIGLMNFLCSEGLDGAKDFDVNRGLQLLDEMARHVDSETKRHLYRYQNNPATFENSEAKFRMAFLISVVQPDYGLRYNPNKIQTTETARPDDHFFADPRDVLLFGLLSDHKMGTCSSMPVLYVAVGRRLGYPLKLVSSPVHLFVRWEDSKERFNIEGTGEGYGFKDDEHYRHWPFEFSKEDLAAIGNLKSMNSADELATFLSIRTACLVEASRLPEAVQALEQCVRLAPTIPAYQVKLADMKQFLAQPRNPLPTMIPADPNPSKRLTLMQQ